MGSLISIPCWDIRIIIQNLTLMSQKDKKIIEVNLKGKELNYHWQFTKWSLKYKFIEDIADNTTKG